MAILNFPDSPALNDTFSYGGDNWIWNGISWEVLPTASPTFETLTVTDIITGKVTDISNHKLRDLGNVQSDVAPDGAFLVYDADTDQWSGQVVTGGFNGGTISGTLFVNNTTSSTSTATGALRVAGGAGIVGNIFAGGNVDAGGTLAAGTSVTVRGSGELRLADADSSNYVGFKSPSSVGSNLVWVLPSTDGTSGQFLRTNGSGVLSWATATGGGGPGVETPPGGADTQVQFNDGGAFGGNAALTFNSSTGLTTATLLSVSDGTQSTSSTTGALTVTGGAGVAKNLNVGGDIAVTGNVSINTTPSAASHATTKSYVDSKITAFSIAFGV